MSDGSMGTALVADASSDLGGAFAAHLARSGYDLVLVVPPGTELHPRAGSLATTGGRRVVTLELRLRHRPDLVETERILRENVSRSLLVNDPGPSDREANVEAADEVDPHVVLARLASAALAGFASRGRGHLLNVGPTFAPGHDASAREDSRAFTATLTRALHKANGDVGIRVQALLPSLVESAAWEVVDPSSDAGPPSGSAQVEAVVAAALRARPAA